MTTAAATDSLPIDGRYLLREPLGRGSSAGVFRAQDLLGGAEVALKIYRPPACGDGAEALLRFRRESRILAGLAHPGIVRFLAFGDLPDGGAYIAMERISGAPLAEMLAAGPLGVETARALAADIASALAYVHEAGVIHGDLKPQNVIVAPGPGGPRAKLIDFGLARSLDAGPEAEDVAGTYGYMSPEQAGVLERPVDARSDLYSLGVVVYEMLVGRRPFEASSLSELLHMHAAKRPAPLREVRPDAPASLEAIVAKLLEKDPDDRYQSAEGVLADLTALESLERAVRERGAGALDAGRRSRALRFEARLVGRDVERAALRRMVDLAARGEGRVLLVHGPPGIGKSRLLDVLREATLARGGAFLLGRADAAGRSAWLGPVVDAVRGRLRSLQRSDPCEHARVLAAFDRAAEAIGDPLVRALAGAPAGAPEVGVETDPDRRRHRLREAALAALLSLGSGHASLVLAIDDLDRADDETVALVERVARQSAPIRLLIVATLTGDPGAGPAGRLLHAEPRPPRLDRLPLLPLAPEHAREFLATRLQPLGEPREELVRILAERSGGVPGAIEGLVRRIAALGSLEAGALAQILEPLPAEARAPALPEALRGRLGRLAALRRPFGFTTAHAALGGSAEESERTIEAIDAAVAAGVLRADPAPPRLYRFADAALRQALRDGLDPAERAAAHARVAEHLAALPPEDPEHAPFEIAYHFDEAGLGARATSYLLRAGDLARAVFAYEDAAAAFRRALEHLERDEAREREMRQVLRSLGEVLISLGRYDEAIGVLGRALERAGSTLERCRISIAMGAAAFRAGEGARATDFLKEALRALDVRVPSTRPGRILSLVRAGARQALHSLLPRVFCGRAGEIPADDLERVRIFRELERIYYFIDSELSFDAHLRGLNLVERYAPTRELGFLSSTHAVLCGLLGLFKRAREYGRRAIAIAEETGDEALAAEANLYLGMAAYWEGAFADALRFLERAEALLARRFDPWTTHAAWYFRGLTLSVEGRYREALQVFESLLESAREVQDERGIATGLLGRAMAGAALGLGGDAVSRIEDACARLRALGDDLSLQQALRALGAAFIRAGDHERALAALEESRATIERRRLTGAHVIETYALLGETLADPARLARLAPAERREALARAGAHVARALRASRRFVAVRAASLRAAARLDAARGRRSAAATRLRQAIRIATERGQRPLAASCAAELAGILAEASPAAAVAAASSAYRIFRELELRAEASALARRFPSVVGTRALAGGEEPTSRGSGSSQAALLAEKRKLEALFEVGKTLHSARDLDRILSRLVEVAMEVTGAERGFLFLTAGGSAPEEAAARAGGEAAELRPIVVRTANQAGPAAVREEEPSLGALGLSRTLLLDIEAKGEPVVLFDAAADEALRRSRSIVASGLRSILCVPLRARSGPIGLLYLDSRLVRGLFGPRDIELLSAFAAQAALAIENARTLRELERANRTLRETQAQLVQSAKMSAVGQLAAGISHEIRNPLNVIGGSIYYLRELLRAGAAGADALGSKVEKCLENMDGEVRRAVGLMDNLLAFARPQDMPFDAVDVNDIVARSIGLVRAMAERRGIAIEHDLPPGLPPVHGNAGHLQQVALNILLNAVQAIEGRGGAGTVRARTRVDGGEVRLEIEDDGPGIPPEHIDRIFEPFFSGRDGGTGLGLYVCYGIVARHGGRIECRSEVGRGALFTVRLPAARTAEPSRAA